MEMTVKKRERKGRLAGALFVVAAIAWTSTGMAQPTPSPSPVPAYGLFQNNAVSLTRRTTANFSSALQLTDDNTNKRTNVTIAAGGVTNAMLATPSLTISTTGPLTGGGPVALGATITLACPSCVTSIPTVYYQTVESNSVAQTQRDKLNFAATFTTTDSAGAGHTTVDVATGGISNAMLANSGITISASSPLGGGASPSLGGSMTLTCTTCITGSPSATGDLLYSTSGAQAMTALADVAIGRYLRSGGVAAAPVWSTLTLPNAATAGDLLYASSTDTIGRLADVAVNQVLLSGGVGGLPAWGTVANAALANSTIGVLAGTGLTGGGTPALGSSATISMPNVGPGAGTIGGGSNVVGSITLDAQGRVTAAVATAPPVALTTVWWSAVDAYTNCRTATGTVSIPAAGSSAEKDGNKYATTRALTVTGVRFYWGGAGNDTIRALIYQAHTTAALLTSVDVSTTGAGTYTGTFATPQSLGANYTFLVAIHQTANNKNDGTCASSTDNAFPVTTSSVAAALNFRGTFFCTSTCANTDATVPTSATANLLPVEPVITVP